MFTQTTDGKLFFDAQIVTVKTLRDKAASITLHTCEIPKGKGGRLLDLSQAHVAVMIKEFEDHPYQEEADVLDALQPTRKQKGKKRSYSQRLREVIYIRWQKEGEQGSFDEFYEKRMDELIDEEKLYFP